VTTVVQKTPLPHLESAEAAGQPPKSRSLTILLVEDDPMVRSNLDGLLFEAGHKVYATSSGDDAMAALGAGLLPDLAVLDIHMSGSFDGIALAKLLYEGWDVRSIFVSGFLEGPTYQQALRSGPLSIIRKPFSSADLMRALQLAEAALFDSVPDSALEITFNKSYHQ
jgi:CheY-like chemotaxis protein